MHSPATARRPVPGARPRGFTLIETLVAMLVLSIGMLGIAALYVEGLRSSRAALVRTEAINLATDMADRIRSNRDAGPAYADDPADAADADCMSGGGGCTPAAMAAHDLRLWTDSIEAALPEGEGAITHVDVDANDATPAVYVITVSWTDPGQGTLSFIARVEA